MVFVRGIKRAAHHQPRTPTPGVPCGPDKPPEQQVTRYAGGRRFRALSHSITIVPNFVRYYQAYGGGDGGFSVLFRLSPWTGSTRRVRRASDSRLCPWGDSRKNRPRAERPACAEPCSAGRRVSFWSFFLGDARKRARDRGRKGVGKILTYV